MSRAAGLCTCCGGPRRGKAARLAAPVALCVRCGDGVCDRHVRNVDGDNMCIRCCKILGVEGVKV